MAASSAQLAASRRTADRENDAHYERGGAPATTYRGNPMREGWFKAGDVGSLRICEVFGDGAYVNDVAGKCRNCGTFIDPFNGRRYDFGIICLPCGMAHRGIGPVEVLPQYAKRADSKTGRKAGDPIKPLVLPGKPDGWSHTMGIIIEDEEYVRPERAYSAPMRDEAACYTPPVPVVVVPPAPKPVVKVPDVPALIDRARTIATLHDITREHTPPVKRAFAGFARK